MNSEIDKVKEDIELTTLKIERLRLHVQLCDLKILLLQKKALTTVYLPFREDREKEES